MPLTCVSLLRGKSASYHTAILDSLYQAMRETFDVPEDDRFMTITEHDQAGFSFGKTYHGIHRSDDLVLIQITVSKTRTVQQKQAFYHRIVTYLSASPGLRPEDVFISLVEVAPENWSFGNGIAQYVTNTP